MGGLFHAAAEALKSRDAFTSALEKTSHAREDAAAISRAEQLKEDSEMLQSPEVRRLARVETTSRPHFLFR